MKSQHKLYVILALFIVVLSAAFAPQATRYLGGFSAKEDSYVSNGQDVIWYTGDRSGETVRVDGAGAVRVAVPTTVGTATPGIMVQQGANGNAVEVRNPNATPVYAINKNGVVTGLVYQNSVSGQKCVNGTQSITASATVSHGLSTPVSVQVSLAEDVTGDGATVSYTNAAAVVTAKVWTSAATPVAASNAHSIAYYICGTP